MKLSKRRILACFLAVMLCMAAFSIPAYAEGGDYQEYEIPPEENTNPEVLTPEGNMTLVDDITGEAANEKEFITVVTKNGHYFYIIIDHSAKGNNTVYFLNQVDEADLLALLSDEEKAAYEQEQIPVETPQPTPIPTPVPSEQTSTQPDTTSIRGTVIVVLFALLSSCSSIFAPERILRPKQKALLTQRITTTAMMRLMTMKTMPISSQTTIPTPRRTAFDPRRLG